MKTVLFGAIISALFAWGGSAEGATPNWCNGTVTSVYTDSLGNVYVFGSYRGDYTQVCNVTSAWGAISPQTCVVWVSNLTTAVATKLPVIVFYADLGTNTCATIPTYGNAPAPSYVMLRNP